MVCGDTPGIISFVSGLIAGPHCSFVCTFFPLMFRSSFTLRESWPCSFLDSPNSHGFFILLKTLNLNVSGIFSGICNGILPLSISRTCAQHFRFDLFFNDRFFLVRGNILLSVHRNYRGERSFDFSRFAREVTNATKEYSLHHMRKCLLRTFLGLLLFVQRDKRRTKTFERERSVSFVQTARLRIWYF